MSVTIENPELKVKTGVTPRAKLVGDKIAADFFAGLKPVQDRNGLIKVSETMLAELFAALFEIGRAETLHASFCVKGRQS